VRRLGAAVLAALLVLAACDDDGPVVPGQPPAATTTEPPTTPPTTVAPAAAPTTTDAGATTAASPAATTVTTTSTTATTAAPTTTTTTPPTTTTLPPQPADPAAPRLPLLNADFVNDAYSGIGQLQGLGSTCTAFLIDAGEPSEPAYAMTTGRCVGLADASTVLRDQPGTGGVVTFRLFQDTPSDHAEIPVERVLYATMRGTDVAILALGASRRELAGLTAYGLTDTPSAGRGVNVVGIPAGGLADTDWVLRGDSCTAGPSVRLVEWEWAWDEALATDCKGILPGSAGSPVFARGDPSTAVGMVNTTTIGAAPGRNCGLGQACELTPDGATRQPDRTYAMPIGAWANCFDPDWDPTSSGCPVERAPVMVDAPLRAVRPGGRWGATIAAPTPLAVVKSGPAGTTDCRDPAGYGPPPSGVRYDEPLPPQEGVYVLCAAAIDALGTPDTADAGAAVVEVDATPPDEPIQIARTQGPDGGLSVEPVLVPPEYSSFDVKAGRRASTNCVRTVGYAPSGQVPLQVPADQLPARLCVIGVDEAGNRGAPQTFDLP
jgi:hypothetical protein